MKKLSIDNPFFEFMGKVGDVIIVNILFLICSAPIITMGASVCAMYETFRQMGEDTYISAFRTFKDSFLSSIKKSIPIWLLCFISGAILVFDLMFITRAADIALWHITGMAAGCLMFLWILINCWLFPTAVFKDMGIKEAIRRCMFLATVNLPYTLLMVLLNLIPIVCFILGEYFISLVAPIYFSIGFAATALLNTKIIDRCKTEF